jgi:hypothetical protein
MLARYLHRAPAAREGSGVRIDGVGHKASQKRAPAPAGAPQFGHVWRTACPPLGQNAAPGRLWCPQTPRRGCCLRSMGRSRRPGRRIRQRLPRSLGNARRALPFVDAAWVLDNGDADHPFQVVATTRAGRVTGGRGDDVICLDK